MSRKTQAIPFTPSDDTSVTPAKLAARWRELFGCEPPHRSVLIGQAVAWQEQMLAHGDVAPGIARDLVIAARHAREARQAVIEPDATTCAAIPAEHDVSATRALAACTNSPATAGAARHTARTTSRSMAKALPPASSQLIPGTRLVKLHGGRSHVVEVTESGFTYEGANYSSLSAIAKHITGTHWNGLLFFGLRRRKTYPAKPRAHG